MVRFSGRSCAAVLMCAGLGAPASALNYEVSAEAASNAAPPLGVRLALSALPVGQQELSLALGSRAAEFGLRRNAPLLTIGTLNVGVGGAYAFAGGGRLGLEAGGTLGPIALSAAASVWNLAAQRIDPLSVWSLAPTNPQSSGAALSAQLRYRLRRDLILTGSGELGAQSQASISAEWHRGALSYRLGARGGQAVLGAEVGVSYRAEAYTLSADALLGAQSGVDVQLSAPALIALGGERAADLSAYLAYESWRTAALPLRYGAELSAQLSEQSTLSVGVRGGVGGVGGRLGWRYSPPNP